MNKKLNVYTKKFTRFCLNKFDICCLKLILIKETNIYLDVPFLLLFKDNVRIKNVLKMKYKSRFNITFLSDVVKRILYINVYHTQPCRTFHLSRNAPQLLANKRKAPLFTWLKNATILSHRMQMHLTVQAIRLLWFRSSM